MKVILQKDVKNLGKIGDLIQVANGYARNFLFPRLMAVEATETRVKEFQHLKKVADSNRRKAAGDKKAILDKLSGKTLKFFMQAGESDKLFGSITNKDISDLLEKDGFSIDRRDIFLEEPIRVLGQHKATVKLGDGLNAEIALSVERATSATADQ